MFHHVLYIFSFIEIVVIIYSLISDIELKLRVSKCFYKMSDTVYYIILPIIYILPILLSIIIFFRKA